MADDVAAPDGELKGSATGTIETTTATEETATSTAEPASGAAVVDEDAADDAAGAEDYDAAGAALKKPPMSVARIALVGGLTVVVALGALCGWLGYRVYQSHQAEQLRELFVQVGRQGALNLTTIDFAHADADIQRILDSATGTFYDDFAQRSKPFVDVVKQAQSKSVGTVTEAGLESENGDQAQVLVAVAVKTSNAGAAEQAPRAWRMRISVQKVGDQAKVSNVEFVP
jgi:Mce-associated membrane protein